MSIKTRNSSGDEIANVNFLYDRRHCTHTRKYNRFLHKFRHRSFSATPVYQIHWNNAMKRPLCRSRSFKVTDFGTNRKLIYDLVINTNLPPILHRFQVMTDNWSNLLARAECLTLSLSLGVTPANIAINDISQKTRFCGLHFRCRKYWRIFNHFYVIRPESYRIRWNCTAVRAITPFKVIQGQRVWYQSKAHMRLPISD